MYVRMLYIHCSQIVYACICNRNVQHIKNEKSTNDFDWWVESESVCVCVCVCVCVSTYMYVNMFPFVCI